MSQPFRVSGVRAATAATAAGVALMSMATASPAAKAAPDTPASAASGGATPTVTVAASGLNDPKNITPGPGGLYVAESGTGGSSCVQADGNSLCEGGTGAVALVSGSGVRDVLSGLPSVVNSAEGTLGPAGVTFDHGELAVLFQDTAVNSDGVTSAQGPGANFFGKVLFARPFSGSSGWTAGPDIAGYAAAHPQDPSTLGGIPGGETTYDSDPYIIVPYRGGYAVADAAANDVLWISPAGDISVLDRLPTIPETVPAGVLGPDPQTIDAQAVPTSLAVGPDGALYAGTLPGFPAESGTATVYRLVPGHAATAAVTGLTMVSGIAFDAHGRLLVLEYDTAGGLDSSGADGALLRVSHSGDVSTLPVSGMSEPTGIATTPDGAVYVSVNGDAGDGSGKVLKITGLG